MSYTIEDIVKRHRELTAEQAVISARHSEELKPTNESIKAIETWLLAKMTADGVQNYKTPFGTAYQSRLKSVKMEDATEFRNFVLYPAALHIIDLVSRMGGVVNDRERDAEAILSLIGTLSLWDLADFRPGKKGIIKHQEETGEIVPGISFNEVINVNVRGS